MDMEQALQTFLAESRELLQAMEEGLLNLESQPDDTEAIGAVFRAAHTIKGSAGLFGLDDIVAFTHVAENLLDKVRSGSVAIEANLIAVLLEAGDHIGVLVDHVEAHRDTLDDTARRTGEALLNNLRGFLGAPPQAQVMPAAQAPLEQRQNELQSCGGGPVGSDSWHISLRFGHDVLKNGMDPQSFIRYLSTLGEITSITTLPDAIPPAENMDPESCYLGFEIDLRSNADKATIEGVFEFVRDDCNLRILPPHSRIGEYIQLISELPEDKERLGEILINSGVITQKERDDMLLCQSMRVAGDDAAPHDLIAPLGELLVREGMVQKEVVDAALEKQKQVRDHKAQESKYIRVHADKLDSLINLVGELVITSASAGLQAKQLRNAPLLETTSTMARLVEEIRDDALQLRMVQIGETFSRFHRVVRDVGKELGKEIALEIGGAETELDKSVVEKIGDPLMHLVRNSMDHGIEPAEVRLSRGKPAKGTVRLNAFHESGSIVIEVGDDGGGLKRQRILAKALEKGLVTPNQNLSDKEVYNLIFEAGFSTADAVTNLSGRGVGMDVVRRNIEALRGTVEIDSSEGIGTTMRIRLPLTLAIIDGFMMGVGRETYVAPLDMVRECLELTPAQRLETRTHNYIDLRGNILPVIRLRDHFGCEGKPGKRENVVVVQYAGQRAGLVVDALMGEYQTVIKPLGKLFGSLKGIGGSTILGSGEVALLLDVPALIQDTVARETRAYALLGARG